METSLLWFLLEQLCILLCLCFFLRPFLRPKKSPPREIMVQHECDFDKWLDVLYRDNLSLKMRFYRYYSIACPNRRIGQDEPNLTLFLARTAFDEAYVQCLDWDDEIWAMDDEIMGKWAQNLTPILQRFDLSLDWQKFDEYQWNADDKGLLKAVLYWLQYEFSHQDVFLYVPDCSDDKRVIVLAIPMKDKADFLAASRKWGLTSRLG